MSAQQLLVQYTHVFSFVCATVIVANTDAGKDGKRLNMNAAAAAVESAVQAQADAEHIAALQATLVKQTEKYSKANKGEGTAKGIGWEENGRRNGE